MPSKLQHGVDALSRQAQEDLAVVYDKLQGSSAVDIRNSLMEVLPQLVDRYGAAAASLAADHYDELRDAAGAAGHFSAVAAEPVTGSTDVLARWAVGPLFSDEPDYESALSNAAGGMQRLIADSARDTVMGSSIADPGARGWERVSDGGSCDFCQMLVDRGAVYTESSAEFQSHNHCNCGAEPVFEESSAPVEDVPVEDSAPEDVPAPVEDAGGRLPGETLVEQRIREQNAIDAVATPTPRAVAPRALDDGQIKRQMYSSTLQREQALKGLSSWPREEETALRVYTSEAYPEMNLMKRDPSAYIDTFDADTHRARYIADQNAALEKAIQRNTLDKDVVVARGVKDDLSHLLPGEFTADPAFLSTTGDMTQALSFAGADSGEEGWVYIIQVPKGTGFAPGTIGVEKELIFEPGLKQRILKVDESTRTVHTLVVK